MGDSIAESPHGKPANLHQSHKSLSTPMKIVSSTNNLIADKKSQENISGGDNSNNIQFGDDADDLDNPTEMMMLEGEEDQDDDPEALEEIERRNDEIVEQFMELSLNKKHD